LDLFPCTKEELRSIGYKDSSAQQIESSVLPKEFHAKVDDDVEVFIKPDKSQMIPFKPRRLPAPGAHPVQGGEFPMPNAAHNVLKLMPPPVCFHGPFVRVDDLIEKFRTCELPELNEFLKVKPSGGKGLKRVATEKNDDSGSGDVFRQRQQKRAAR